jgi:hypothetical protein
MKEIKFIELVLENCEIIKIDKQHIGIFRIENIKRSISRVAMNSISDHKSAEEVFIQISSKANNYNSYVTTWSGNETLPFTRLIKYKDITAISIHYEDDDEEYIYVPWGGESDYKNEYQSCKINEHTGDLYIIISEKENVENYFKECLEDEDTYWESYEE